MGKISFRFGAVGASKTANMLMVKYNYEERGMKTVLLKPQMENRDGATKIRSRIGLEAECQFIEDFLKNPDKDADCILIDEAQFMDTDQIDAFVNIADSGKTHILAYGLKNDFKGHLFEGSKRWIEVADELEEIPTICWCGKKARFTARVENGRVVKEGELIKLGGNESYTSLCRKHYNLGQLQPELMLKPKKGSEAPVLCRKERSEFRTKKKEKNDVELG